MTNRVNALIVVLEKDAREDDVQMLCRAIEQFRGVIKVECNISAPSDFIAQSRAKRELTDKLWEAFNAPI